MDLATLKAERDAYKKVSKEFAEALRQILRKGILGISDCDDHEKTVKVLAEIVNMLMDMGIEP